MQLELFDDLLIGYQPCPKCDGAGEFRKAFTFPDGTVKHTWLCKKCNFMFITIKEAPSVQAVQ